MREFPGSGMSGVAIWTVLGANNAIPFRSRFASARLSFSGDAKTALFYAVVGWVVLFAHTVCFMLFDGLLLLVRLGRRLTLT